MIAIIANENETTVNVSDINLEFWANLDFVALWEKGVWKNLKT
jgi:hypothetical protein